MFSSSPIEHHKSIRPQKFFGRETQTYRPFEGRRDKVSGYDISRLGSGDVTGAVVEIRGTGNVGREEEGSEFPDGKVR